MGRSLSSTDFGAFAGPPVFTPVPLPSGVNPYKIAGDGTGGLFATDRTNRNVFHWTLGGTFTHAVHAPPLVIVRKPPAIVGWTESAEKAVASTPVPGNDHDTPLSGEERNPIPGMPVPTYSPVPR